MKKIWGCVHFDNNILTWLGSRLVVLYSYYHPAHDILRGEAIASREVEHIGRGIGVKTRLSGHASMGQPCRSAKLNG